MKKTNFVTKKVGKVRKESGEDRRGGMKERRIGGVDSECKGMGGNKTQKRQQGKEGKLFFSFLSLVLSSVSPSQK